MNFDASAIILTVTLCFDLTLHPDPFFIPIVRPLRLDYLVFSSALGAPLLFSLIFFNKNINYAARVRGGRRPKGVKAQMRALL